MSEEETVVEETGQEAETTEGATAPPASASPDSTQEQEHADFTDASQLPPELKSHYDRMRGDYTRKTQEIAKHRQKIQAYDAFSANPVAAMQQIARQYGYNLVQGNGQGNGHDQAAGQQGQQPQQDFNPQSWGDVAQWLAPQIRQQLMQEVQQQFQPYMEAANTWKRSQIESTLDSEFPTWRDYEQDLVQTLQQHPSLANNPSLLLRAGLPADVLESRATKRALEKLQAKTNGAKVGRGSTTSRTPSSTPGPAKSFAEAVAQAKAILAEQGSG